MMVEHSCLPIVAFYQAQQFDQIFSRKKHTFFFGWDKYPQLSHAFGCYGRFHDTRSIYTGVPRMAPSIALNASFPARSDIRLNPRKFPWDIMGVYSGNLTWKPMEIGDLP